MKNYPVPFEGMERMRQLSYALIYVIRNSDNGTVLQLTNFDQPMTVSAGMLTPIPATWADGNFTPAAIQHDSIQLTSDTTLKGISVSIAANNILFQRMFLTMPTSRIFLEVYRINKITTPTTDQMVQVFAGELGASAFAGYIFTGSFLPLSFAIDKPIPRFFNQRFCNYCLYGAGCMVNKDHFSAQSTIIAFNRYARQLQVSIAAISPSTDIAGGLFGNGYFIEPTTNSKIGISMGEDNDDGTAMIYPLYWIPELEVAGSILLTYQGCSHTIAGCQHFGNVANFGGEPFIPTQNPSYDGIG